MKKEYKNFGSVRFISYFSKVIINNNKQITKWQES